MRNGVIDVACGLQADLGTAAQSGVERSTEAHEPTRDEAHQCCAFASYGVSNLRSGRIAPPVRRSCADEIVVG